MSMPSARKPHVRICIRNEYRTSTSGISGSRRWAGSAILKLGVYRMRKLAIAGQLTTVAANHSLFALTRLCSKTPNFSNGTHLSRPHAFLSIGSHFLHSKLLYLYPLKGHTESNSIAPRSCSTKKASHHLTEVYPFFDRLNSIRKQPLSAL